MRKTSALLLGSLLAAAAGSAAAAISDPVMLDSGAVSGKVENGVAAYKGIPFAAPPVGELRWQAPQAVPKWQGVRAADQYGHVCVQPAGGRGYTNIALLPQGPTASEDCLYLNVWTPASSPSAKLPVMVYIYGGAFTQGAGSIPLYDGTNLAKKGVIVVTMNYRLGAFGFFAHPALTKESEHHASGDYGLMDMLASLRWVQRNIAGFGGDPANVTVFGQSAGAMAIAALVGSPRSAGLFKRAISESGAWMGLGPGRMRTLDQAEQAGAKEAQALGAETAEALRKLPADEVAAKLRGAGMIVDGYVIPEDVTHVFEQGKQQPVDVLVGSNKDEGSFFGGRGASAEQFKKQQSARWGTLAEKFFMQYSADTDAEAAKSSEAVFRDGAAWLMRLYANYQAEKGQAAYVYYFAQNPPGKEGQPYRAATHAAELPYVFDNLGQLPLYPDNSDPVKAKASAPDRKVAELMSSYWTNFARTGNPNGAGLPQWPAFKNVDQGQAMVLKAQPQVEQIPSPAKLELFDKLFHKMEAGGASAD